MTTTNELQLWQSIASLNCVERLRIEVNPQEMGHVFVLWDGQTYETWETSHRFHHRVCALLIVDAIEAKTDWRFERRPYLPTGSYWQAWKPGESGPVWDDDSETHLPEHLSLLTVLSRVMRELKEGK